MLHAARALWLFFHGSDMECQSDTASLTAGREQVRLYSLLIRGSLYSRTHGAVCGRLAASLAAKAAKAAEPALPFGPSGSLMAAVFGPGLPYRRCSYWVRHRSVMSRWICADWGRRA